MYKLYKMFNSKGKQLARDREKEAGGGLTGGLKKDKTAKTQELDFAPVKLSSQIQDNIRLFKVHAWACRTSWILSLLMMIVCLGAPACNPHPVQPRAATEALGQDQ